MDVFMKSYKAGQLVPFSWK